MNYSVLRGRLNPPSFSDIDDLRQLCYTSGYCERATKDRAGNPRISREGGMLPCAIPGPDCPPEPHCRVCARPFGPPSLAPGD